MKAGKDLHHVYVKAFTLFILSAISLEIVLDLSRGRDFVFTLMEMHFTFSLVPPGRAPFIGALVHVQGANGLLNGLYECTFLLVLVFS